MDFSRYRRPMSILLLGLTVIAHASTTFADSFDVPLKTKVVDLGSSDNNLPGRQSLRLKLSCFFYPNFVIKQYDNQGEKGAQWVAIVPVEKGAAPACTRTHVSGERVFEPPELNGYFYGVKRNLVFLNDADGMNGGMPFTIYDSRTGKKIFRDSSGRWMEKTGISSFDRLRFGGNADSDFTMTYMRAVEVDCDLHTEKNGCWEKVRKKLALKEVQMPVCTRYENISSWYASAVAYPVQVSLFPKPVTRTIAGPVKCFPAD